MPVTDILDKIKSHFIEFSSENHGEVLSWQGNGSYPRDIFPKLLEILHYYFEVARCKGYPKTVGDDPQYDLHIEQFKMILKAAYPEDILFFCAQSFEKCYVVKTNAQYIGCVLKKILASDFRRTSEEEMKSLAEWLLQYDPSYIVKSHELDKVYANYCVGPAFDLAHFKKNCLPLLKKNVHPHDLAKKLDRFTDELQHEEEFTSKILDKLASIYAFRWDLIKGTNLDYTRQKQRSDEPRQSPEIHQKENRSWIFVAQCLQGAGKLMSSGYYQFLMPSIESNIVYATDEPLEYYSLFHFILSDKGDRLLSLDTSFKYFDNQQNCVLCNRDVWPPRMFTTIEMERVQYSAKRFSDRQDLFKTKHELSVWESTVDLVYEFVQAAFKKDFINNALEELAYLDVSVKLSCIDQEEQKRLYSQRVCWKKRDYSLFDILEMIGLGGHRIEGCITTWGLYLIKFVIDYRPDVNFGSYIENASDLELPLMRAASAKKCFRKNDADEVNSNNISTLSPSMAHCQPHFFFGGDNTKVNGAETVDPALPHVR